MMCNDGTFSRCHAFRKRSLQKHLMIEQILRAKNALRTPGFCSALRMMPVSKRLPQEMVQERFFHVHVGPILRDDKKSRVSQAIGF